VKPEEIPAELVAMLDQTAGRTHSRNGRVVTALAAILTRYEELRNPSGAQQDEDQEGPQVTLDELTRRAFQQFIDAHVPPGWRTAEFTMDGAAYYGVTPGQRTALMAMAGPAIRALNEPASTTEPRSGEHAMNHADACAELRRRGYSSTVAAEAVTQTRMRVSGTYALDRHLVRYTGAGGYQISPLPWPEGETRRPGPAGETRTPPPQDMMPVHLGEILVKIQLVDAWIDASTAPAYRDQPLAGDWSRITKPLNEAMEAKEALAGVTGENPRKGVCDTWEHVLEELGDTACAALMGIQHKTKDINETWRIFLASLEKAYNRVPPGQRHVHEDDGTVEGCPGCFEDEPDTASDAIRALYAEPEGLYAEPEGLYEDPPGCGDRQPHQRHVYSPAGGLIQRCPGVRE
jgi:hypothetical protein